MKKLRWSGALFGLAIVLVAIVAVGWLALSGRVDWLARLAKPRIEAALEEAGVVTEELMISRLALNGGRIETAKFRTDAGVVEIHGVEVVLGWKNLRTRRAGAVTIDRLDLALVADSNGFPTKGPSPDFSLPFDSVEIREWRMSVPLNGTVKRITGKLRAVPDADGSVAVEGNFEGSGVAGTFSGRYIPAAGTGTFRFADVALGPAGASEWINAFLAADAGAGLSYDWESAVADGEIVVDANEPSELRANINVDRGAVSRSSVVGEFAGLSLRVEWNKDGTLRFETDAAGMSGKSDRWTASAATIQLAGNRSGANIAVGNAVVNSGGRRADGHALGSLVFGESFVPASAEGTVILDSATFDGLKSGNAEIPFRWEGDVVSATAAHVGLTGWLTADLQQVEIQLTGLAKGEPGISGSAVIDIDAGVLAGTAINVTPAREKITATFLGLLDEGRESVRVEFEADATSRTVTTGTFKGEGIGGISGVVTLDANNVSGSVTGEWKDARLGFAEGRSADFPNFAFKWTLGRKWIEATRAWSDAEPARWLRELLWVSNIDLRGDNGSVNLGDAGRADGLSFRVLSNGADLSEQAGGSLVFSAGSLVFDGRQFANVGGVLELGLDGGNAVLDFELDRPRIPVHSRQALNWSAGLAMTGEFATPPLDLATIGPLDGIAETLRGISASGTAAVRGTTRLGPDGFDATARIEMSDVGLDWPQEKATVEGLSGRVEFDSIASPRARAGQRVTFQKANISSVEFSLGTLEFGMPSPALIEVSRMDARTMGGSISAAAFSFDPTDPRPATRIRLAGVQLEQLLKFFPNVPAKAEAPIVGELPVSWNGTELEFGAGFIDLKPGELGRLWLNYDPRMLTAGRSKKSLLYPTLRRIERALLDLHFDRLRIDLYPPESPGRTLQIRLAGVTAAEDVRAPFVLDVNVNVPLSRFTKWGTANPFNTQP